MPPVRTSTIDSRRSAYKTIADFTMYLHAVSALLRPQSRVTAAKADITMIALHLTKAHVPTIEQDSPAFSAVKNLFDTMVVLLQYSRTFPQGQWILPLRQDWCFILTELMTMSSFERPQVSVVPSGLALALVACLEHTPDDVDDELQWRTLGLRDPELSTSDGSRLSIMILAKLVRVLGGAGYFPAPASTANPVTHPQPRPLASTKARSLAPNSSRVARPPMIR
jgi:hypothetical protein